MVISSAVFAQHQGGNQRGEQAGPPKLPNAQQIEEMVSNMADEISLSTEQESTILDLYINHFKIAEKKMSANERPKKEEMDALNEDLEKKVKAELSKKQVKKYKAFLKKQKPQRPPQ